MKLGVDPDKSLSTIFISGALHFTKLQMKGAENILHQNALQTCIAQREEIKIQMIS